jgi:hypothetical protein
MPQLRPRQFESGAGAKNFTRKLLRKNLVNQSFDERKIVVLRSDASDKTAKQSEAGYP